MIVKERVIAFQIVDPQIYKVSRPSCTITHFPASEPFNQTVEVRCCY